MTPFAPFRLGSLLVSLMDAAAGQERAFHRWYERDHFYTGCMTGPGFFAGRRFVAPRALRELRRPEAAPPFLREARDGAFLALYFIAAGQEQRAEAWAVERVNRLLGGGRMHPSRRPVHAGFHRHRLTARREPDGVPPELALHHPFAGLVLASFEGEPEVGADRLEAGLASGLARALPRSPIALALAFAPVPLPPDAPAYVPRPPGLEGRRLVVSFVDGDPRGALDALTGLEDDVGGLARLGWLAPFVPTVPGTDRYLDEIP